MNTTRRSIALTLVVSVAITLGTLGVAAPSSVGAESSEALGQPNETSLPEEGPLADAGLDQTVDPNTTVLLDGTGSAGETGGLARYQWTVRSPGGGTFSPCETNCSRTAFLASEPGTYEVELTVEDRAGRTATDTMYVSVASETELAVDADGPDTMTTDSVAPIVATISTGTAPLERIEWYRGDSLVEERSLSENESVETLEIAPDADGDYEYRVVVVDADGEIAADTHDVLVEGTIGNWSREALVVEGPQLITEGDPMTASYRLTRQWLQRIHSQWTEWTVGGNLVGTGGEVTVDWEPGRHSLQANAFISSNEERNTVGTNGWRKASNDHVVTVDPAPEVTFLTVDTTPGNVSAVVEAHEQYSVLTDVSVTVDGTTVAEGPSLASEDRLETATPASTPARTHHSFQQDGEPGTGARITVRATDRRGQTTVRERVVHVPLTEARQRTIVADSHGGLVGLQA